ncbi:benzaldehyde dehydrogenase [Actinophytocola algeriensis]|uniref:Benzaldehyde dehydrogenase (NAD) n=1 Tax=Actinophytocola algeriensis TaxID=1768010 RepID=A0A7W7Q6K5_9PSEU|nr:benzaldehyde dehydrogenase [Actinophytocola algeriensis]MBB4907788.1 benzaldehyde dehydrogenase (NAD) [Actinophytocola algeriensis]MBE1479818.1 benzaldehyde dehydrogenase (NAD) [Actinophytocola algeriensis]
MTALFEPGSLYSGGWVAASGGDTAIVEPATGEELGRTGVADASDVDAACARAAAAQKDWAAATYSDRAAVLRKAGAAIEARFAELRDWVVRETGAVPDMAAFAVGVAAQECYEAAALASMPPGELLPTAEPRLSMLRRVPVGVVGVISPFNVPLILSIRSVAPALALGNAVVLKPDLRTPVSGGFAIARVFAEAGLPDGVLHVLPGGADAGTALVENPRVPVISFTGSTAVGRKVGELAAKHLKRAHLELGGNSALIVLDDADVERAVSAGSWGSFLHQGQICMTTGRHLVHERIAESYVEALAAHATALPVGDPASGKVALGPLIDEGQLGKVHGLVTSTVDAGARLASGGTHEGLFYRPTVLDGVRTDMPAYANEVFGPVAPVVRFADEDEAVALAADSEYGLALSILTGDAMRGLALAERIPTGIVHINDQTVNDEAVAPFGGVAASGTGARFGGLANLDAFTESRWITVRGQIPAYPF